MASPQNLKVQHEDVQKRLVSTVKAVNRIASEDLAFQRTINPRVAEHLDDKSSRVLELASQLLQSAARACGIESLGLEETEDIDMKWRSIVDVVDSVLEKADTAIDEYTGLVKRKESSSADTGPKAKRPKSAGQVIRNANVIKPQNLFEKKPDNFSTGPWKPILTTKPHASVPLEQSLLVAGNDKGTPQYKHPYESEISQMEYPERIRRKETPITPHQADSTEAVWVDTLEGVQDMLQDLKQATEIAVDLEHHDFRTYTGLVCLMQLSTREKDWIVDTLQPWRHKLEILNEVFADSKIIKVFHGAYMDIIWLQRDLGLYVNGLFDTYFACDLLGYPGKSLAYLLSKFVNFDADKQYQLADWRQRPISKEMLFYARSDTHFLLFIFDHVRNELIDASDQSQPESDLLNKALERSKELSLSRHENPGYNETTGEGSRGWHSYILKNSHLAFDGEQFSIFKALWRWRDETARREDESPNFVLGNNNLLDISRVNPPDVKALHSLLPPGARLAKAQLDEIWRRLQEAKAQKGPSLLDFFASLSSDAKARGHIPKPTKSDVRLPQFDGKTPTTRMFESKLFGSMPISSRWEASGYHSPHLEDTVMFPWQRFVQESNAADNHAKAVEVMEDAPQKAVLPILGQKELPEPQAEFTLKKGRQRQPGPDADPEESTSSSGEDDSESQSAQEAESDTDNNNVIAIVDDAPQKSKKQRKLDRKMQKEREKAEHASKREAKLLRKVQKKEKRKKDEEHKTKNYQAVPFDYSTAATVIHGGRTQTETREAKKVIDPYSKTADENIKGANKMAPVKGERSATFRK